MRYGQLQSRIICYILRIKWRGKYRIDSIPCAILQQVFIKYAHRVGKLIPGTKRRILVSLKYHSDTENILRQSTLSNDIRDFRENAQCPREIAYEICKAHTKSH